MTTREPEFSDLDRAEVLALALHRESLCPLCGRPVEDCEAANERAGATWDARPRGCQTQRALLEAQRGQAQADGKNPPLSAQARVWSIALNMPKRR